MQKYFSKNIFSKKENQRGMTLIEIMVATSIFGIIVITAVGILNSAIRVQKRALATQELLDQTSYAIEYMGRSLRMARKDLGLGCLSQSGLNYEIPGAGGGNEGTSIRFINHLKDDDCQRIFFDPTTNRIKQETSDGTFFLTSESLYVEEFRFVILGKAQPPIDYIQPRVTMFLKIKPEEEGAPFMNIQTSVSQRNLDFQY